VDARVRIEQRYTALIKSGIQDCYPIVQMHLQCPWFSVLSLLTRENMPLPLWRLRLDTVSEPLQSDAVKDREFLQKEE